MQNNLHRIQKKLLYFGLCFCFAFFQGFAQTGHWELLNPQHHPSYRASHGMAPIGKNKVLLFGGSNGNELNDTWIFDLEKNDWEQINCEHSPSPREGLGMCQISENKVLLFGGCDTFPIATDNDLWLFDLDSMDWKKLNPKGWNDSIFPFPTYRMGMAKLNDSIVVIYGGEINDSTQPTKIYSDDTWLYHINTNKWEHKNWFIPRARSGHMMTEIDSNVIFMIGGTNAAFLVNWVYTASDYNWRTINSLKSNLSCQFIGSGAMTCIDKGFAILFGGETGDINTMETWYDSTWIFDYNNKRWTKLEIEPHPSDRLRPQLAKIDSNKIILFGGDSQTIPYSEDTWLFTLDSFPTSVDEINLSKNKLISIKKLNSDEIQIDYELASPGNIKLRIFDMQGNLVFHKSKDFIVSGEYHENLPFSEAPSGIYFITISTDFDVMYGKFLFVR